ncbi:4938e1ad-1b9f-415c-8fec-5fc7636135e0 [Sclerotinia trifoliorum]|uniref:4938e1ad-1b9f-415c-8fec-5fc7636135e0 n=1 Tax=Sclerotinia trifoliorum TaxID=28548 RepID=A0A8H2VNP7_9HELO|nr:4938e1ad-1b9f-415c-8fec-5fc7636135e0 [Sclerotinia trifoliorum]
MASTTMSQHLAAIIPEKGSPLKIVHRPTPTPGPTELLIEVHSIACNPIDYYMRDHGFAVASYPAIPGSDISGIVIAAGSSVPAAAPKVGTRVTAFAHAFFTHGDPDYGAFQKKVLVPASSVCPLPDGISFNEGSILPMAVQTSMAAWYSAGLARGTKLTSADKKGMLVWGGSSSIGGVGIQQASRMGYVVYATASPHHHEYVKKLGASKVFDYKDINVVEKIVKSAKEDGITINLAYDAAGALQPILDILKAVKGDDVAKLASAVLLGSVTPTVEGIDIKFVSAPSDDAERDEWSQWLYWTWLKENLQTGEIVPSPSIKVVDGGLESANKALDELKGGVSGVKLVLEV